MESWSLVVKRLSRYSDTLFTSTKRTEVFHSFWNIITKETHYNSSLFTAIDFDVEENFFGNNSIITIRKYSSVRTKEQNKKIGEMQREMVHYLNLLRNIYFLVVTGSEWKFNRRYLCSQLAATITAMYYIIVDLPGYGSNDSKKNGTNEELHVDSWYIKKDW